jgi:hypothetical protein
VFPPAPYTWAKTRSGEAACATGKPVKTGANAGRTNTAINAARSQGEKAFKIPFIFLQSGKTIQNVRLIPPNDMYNRYKNKLFALFCLRGQLWIILQ